MGRSSRQQDMPQNAYRFAAVTDSMVLDERYVADVVDKPDRNAARVPRIFVGVRNALLMSAVLWAAIIGCIMWVTG